METQGWRLLEPPRSISYLKLEGREVSGIHLRGKMLESLPLFSCLLVVFLLMPSSFPSSVPKAFGLDFEKGTRVSRFHPEPSELRCEPSRSLRAQRTPETEEAAAVVGRGLRSHAQLVFGFCHGTSPGLA